MGVRDLIIYQKMYDAALYALPILNRVPKSYRGSLARDLQATVVHLLTGIVAANADPDRRADVLRDLDVELEVARVLLRLSHDLQVVPTKQYGLLSQRLDEVGRLLGGWRGRSGSGPGGMRRRSVAATGTTARTPGSSLST
jgi:hypothetical protein